MNNEPELMQSLGLTDERLATTRDELKRAIIERCNQTDEPATPGKMVAYAKVYVKGRKEPLVFYHGRRAIVDQAVARIKNKTHVVSGVTTNPDSL